MRMKISFARVFSSAAGAFFGGRWNVVVVQRSRKSELDTMCLIATHATNRRAGLGSRETGGGGEMVRFTSVKGACLRDNDRVGMKTSTAVPQTVGAQTTTTSNCTFVRMNS